MTNENSEQTYTLAQIKKAFWARFHEKGELWFNYLDSPEENEEDTNASWEAFLEELEKP